MFRYIIETVPVSPEEDEVIYFEEIHSSFLLPQKSIGIGLILPPESGAYPTRRISKVTVTRE